MPPKIRIRRPAAVVRGGARLRRPAAREAQEGGGGAAYTPADPTSGGKLFEWKTVAIKGRYWEAACELAGQVVRLERAAGRECARVEVSGTRNEGLLKYLTGLHKREVLVALPSREGVAPSWSDHTVECGEIRPVDLGEEPWMTNLKEEPRREGGAGEDELAPMRQEALQVSLQGEALRKQEDPPGRSRSRRRRRRSSSDRKKKKERRKSSKKRAAPQKELVAIFGNTGLDPDPEVRQRFMRRAKKLNEERSRKRRRSSSRSSEGSDSSSSAMGESARVGQTKLFSEGRKVEEIFHKYPGTLANSWVEDSQEYLVTAQGHQMDITAGKVPPIATLYFRSQVASKVSPPMAREFMTLSSIVDKLLGGNASMAMDIATQRMKALEAMSQGIHYSVTNQFELIKLEKSMSASASETQLAAKQAREEERVLQKAAKGVSKGFRQDLAEKGQKGKAKGKGKDREGKGGAEPKAVGAPKRKD